jgi:hypothetical protein
MLVDAPCRTDQVEAGAVLQTKIQCGIGNWTSELRWMDAIGRSCVVSVYLTSQAGICFRDGGDSDNDEEEMMLYPSINKHNSVQHI